MKFPLLVRGLAIAGVALAILVPIHLIAGKVAERQGRAQEVQRKFAAENSGPQTVAGPILELTCEMTLTEERQVMRGGKAETIAEKKQAACPSGYFTPAELRITARMPVERLYRGIYPINVYRADAELAGTIAWPAPPRSEGDERRTWKQATLVLEVSDKRGIKSLEGGALRHSMGDYSSRTAGEIIPFQYKLKLAGTGSLAFAPVGDQSEIRITSDWPHPSFFGGWSPDQRSVTASGFEATWRTTRHATGGQREWQDAMQAKRVGQAAVAGVSLFEPVNIYTLAYRATEYGFLFVLFTFAALALMEATAGVRLHPIQYLLVGSALAVFFLLLLAISEHVAFANAYLAAAVACVLLLTAYLRHAVGSLLRLSMLFTMFTGLYATLYFLIISEDNAMLMGSLLVFALLTITMLATRKVDWGAMSLRMGKAPA